MQHVRRHRVVPLVLAAAAIAAPAATADVDLRSPDARDASRPPTTTWRSRPPRHGR